jgi:hypothetical protein
MVTGFVTAAVQVAVTIAVGEDERWTEGSLTVQLALTSAAVLAVQGVLPPPEKAVELKVWLLPGAAAVWFAAAVAGVTFKPITLQVEPPQPTVNSSATPERTATKDLNVTMAYSFVSGRRTLCRGTTAGFFPSRQDKIGPCHYLT